jgi:hypothetical protein
MAVETADGRLLDVDNRELTAPDFTSVDVSLSTPRVLASRTVREMQVLKADAAAFPNADREFSRTERLLVRFEAYAPGVSPTITARLLNRQGKPIADLSVQPGPAPAYLFELPLASLPPGEYLVEIAGASEAGTAQELFAFRVTG